MPPGSKKRRAARRKQQQHASDSQGSQPSSPHPQGNGGPLHDLNGSTDASDDDRDSPRAPVNGVGGDVADLAAADLSPPPEAVSEVRVSEPEEVRVSEPAIEEVRVSEPAIEEVRVLEPAVEEVRVSELAEEVRVLEPAAEEARVSGVSEVRVSEPEEVRISEPEEETRVSGVSEVRISEAEDVRVSEPEEEARVSVPEIPATAAAAVSVEPAVYVDAVSEEVVQAVEDKAVLSENVVDALVVSAVEKPCDVVVGDEFPRVEEGRGVEGREAAITEEAAPAPAPAPLIRRRAAWWNCCGLFDVARGAEA